MEKNYSQFHIPSLVYAPLLQGVVFHPLIFCTDFVAEREKESLYMS